MAPKKVNLQRISHESTRRATFKKRLTSLMKRTSNLVTLCGIKACVVVYGEGKSQPEVWPSVPEARELLNRFKAMPDYLENYKKTLNQEDFLRSRISHVRHQLAKSDHQNSELETSFLLHKIIAGHHSSLIGLSNEVLTSLQCMVQAKMKNIKERFQQLQGQPFQEPPRHSMLFSSQRQAPHTYSAIQDPIPTKGPQP